MIVTLKYHVPTTPSIAGEVICSPAFNDAIERERQEFVSTRYELLEQTDAMILFDVITDEYPRTMTGSINRRKILTSKNRKSYDVKKQRLHWTYTGQGSGIADVSGLLQLLPSGEATDVVHEITIKVKIPVIGEWIAGFIAAEFKKSITWFDRVLQDQVQRRRQSGACCLENATRVTDWLDRAGDSPEQIDCK